MEESGRLIDIVVFCVAGFLIPIIFFVFLRGCIEDTTLHIQLQSFAEKVSTKGILDCSMYESLLNDVAVRGAVKANMVVEHERWAPEYEMCSVFEVTERLEDLWNGNNILSQETVMTQRPIVLDPGVPQSDGLSENVNGASVAVTGPSSSHVHTDSCYNGLLHFHDSDCLSKQVRCSAGCKLHKHTGSNTSGSGCYSGRYVSGSYKRCGTITNTYEERDVLDCPNCSGDYTWWITIVYGTCDGCGSNRCVVKVITDCDSCIFSSESNTTYVHEQQSAGYYEVGCGKSTSIYYFGNIACTACYGNGYIDTVACEKDNGSYYNPDGTLCTVMCTQVVTSLTPIVKEQVLAMGAGVDARAKAVFADGHSEVVTCAVTGFNASTANVVQTVTLSYGTYSGSLSNKTATKCTVKVMIKYQTNTCSNGHIHYLTDGVSTVCPFCKAYPKTLTVLGASEVPFHMRKGTTLRQNGISLKVTYMDGHTETITSGWTDNLDMNYVGEQTVTIGYLGASTTLKVYNERVKVSCSVCGYEYSLYPDNTDPGCPKCLSAIPVFTGNVLRYKESVSYGEILDELYHGDGIYYFSRGDILKLQLWKTEKTPVNTILGKLFGRGAGGELVSMYSVKIRDEKVRK